MIRFLDIVFSLIGLVLLSPLFLIVALWIIIDSPGPAFYRQQRVGKDGRDFGLLKFRSMRQGADQESLITIGERDARVTRAGYYIRKYKLDELPQLWNVLVGDMSLVGPRPEVRKYVNLYTPEQRKVLSVRPGITDYASIEYIDENRLLAQSSNPDKTYTTQILPAKIALNMCYIEHQTLGEYVKIICLTIGKLFRNTRPNNTQMNTQNINHMNKRIYLCLAHMSGKEQEYIQEAFATNWVVPLGPNVNGFEQDLKQYIGQGKEVVALSSGTAAVHLALIACGVEADDEVICQSFTFCASANPVRYLGATPVFVDSEADSWNMDPALMEQAIIDRKARTGKYPKAIIPVSLYGMPYRIEQIMAIADKYGIPVIEDAAEGLGSRWQGRAIGTYGEYGVLSFNGNKMITTSGGGALICKDVASKQKILWLATQAREAYPYYQHEAIGYNYRLSNICAGIGRGQMTVLDEHIAHHQHIAQLYSQAFAEIDGISLHLAPSDAFDSNYWLCTALLDENLHIKDEEQAYSQAVQGAIGGAAGVVHGGGDVHTDCEPNRNVEALRIWLDKAGIESRPLWKPMHKQPVFSSSPAYTNGTSEAIFKTGICLPSGPMVTDEDVAFIIRTIREAII